MKVAIVGAGKLGLTITETLLGGGNDITLIDKDEARIQRVSSLFDVLTVTANAKRTDVLKDLGIHRYDLLIAATDNDERNMVICNIAKSMGCPKVIARVRSAEHAGQLDFIKKSMGIDYVVNPDMACANEIAKYLTKKYTFEDGRFVADGVAILEIKINKLPNLINKQIKEAGPLLKGLLIGAISRKGMIIVPNGNITLLEDDTLYVVGLEKEINKISAGNKEKNTTNVKKVMIAGGGKTGFFLANTLSHFGCAVKIIEMDRERCEYLSARLNNVLTLHGDATDTNLLEEEGLDEMDAFVAVTGFDEENLLLSMIARQNGVEDIVTKVSRKSYAPLTETLGVSMIINPMDMSASDILRYTQTDKNLVFAQAIQGQAEFIEIWAEKGMPITEKSLMELDIPEGVLICAIHRNSQIIIPGGSTKINPHDRVIILSKLSSTPMLEGLLKRAAVNQKF